MSPTKRQYETSEQQNARIVGNLTSSTRGSKPSKKALESIRYGARSNAYLAMPLSTLYHTFSTLQGKRLHRNDLPPEPQHWGEVMKHPCKEQLKKAMDEEWAKLEKKGTWTKIRKPIDFENQVLPVRWVFAYKLDAEGFLIRFKARLCVRGDFQLFGQNEDVYAATGAYRTFRIMMAITAAFDLNADHLDMVNAFCNADIRDDVWIEMPKGFQESNCILKLQKALYGLRKSPLLWFDEISTFMVHLRFIPHQEEKCLFTHQDLPIYVFLYVDDLVVIAPEHFEVERQQVMAAIMGKYECRNLGPIENFLGMRVLRDRKGKRLWLC
jgi:hypothetical protein